MEIRKRLQPLLRNLAMALMIATLVILGILAIGVYFQEREETEVVDEGLTPEMVADYLAQELAEERGECIDYLPHEVMVGFTILVGDKQYIVLYYAKDKDTWILGEILPK